MDVIINPVSMKKHSIHSKIGMRLLKKYNKTFSGGASESDMDYYRLEQKFSTLGPNMKAHLACSECARLNKLHANPKTKMKKNLKSHFLKVCNDCIKMKGYKSLGVALNKKYFESALRNATTSNLLVTVAPKKSKVKRSPPKTLKTSKPTSMSRAVSRTSTKLKSTSARVVTVSKYKKKPGTLKPICLFCGKLKKDHIQKVYCPTVSNRKLLKGFTL